MLGICLHEMAEMIDEKIKDKNTSLKMKEALFKLELGLRSVEVVQLQEKVAEKTKELENESKKTSDK